MKPVSKYTVGTKRSAGTALERTAGFPGHGCWLPSRMVDFTDLSHWHIARLMIFLVARGGTRGRSNVINTSAQSSYRCVLQLVCMWVATSMCAKGTQLAAHFINTVIKSTATFQIESILAQYRRCIFCHLVFINKPTCMYNFWPNLFSSILAGNVAIFDNAWICHWLISKTSICFNKRQSTCLQSMFSIQNVDVLDF